MEMLESVIIFCICWLVLAAIFKCWDELYYKKKHFTDRYFKDNVAEPKFLIKAVPELLKKKEMYLQNTRGVEIGNLLLLDELFYVLPDLYQKYATEILRAPLSLSKPPNPYTAAYIGEMVGGTAVGMVAAQNAIEKEKAYKENRNAVFLSQINVGNAYDKLNNCYWSIVSIIEMIERNKEDWDKTVNDIIAELDGK